MNNVVGIDVGVGTIKVVSLSKSDNKLFLESIGEVDSPDIDWAKSKADTAQVDQVVKRIKSLMSDLKIKSRQVVASLPEDEVVSRLIRLPPLQESEIVDALKFEAETFIPYPLSEVSIDYEVIDKDESGRLTVFTIAARNDLIQSYIKLFKSAGLDLLALESPSIAMRRVVVQSVSDKVALLMVDLGEQFSDIIGINEGNVYFTRSIPVGGESLTRAISINLGLDMQSAEEYKKAYGLKEMELEGKIKNAITPVFSSMAEEIRRALGSFREELGASVNLLVLSGGGANMPGFAEELNKLLGLEVQVIQPFLRVDSSRIPPILDLNSEGCRFSLAVGLAMRGLI
jgi:type IV pilus assembly protein PilM